MENVINSSASWPWSLTLAAPILPRKPDSVIAIRETLHPFVFCCNPSQDIDGLPYFFVTSILRCFLVAKNILSWEEQQHRHWRNTTRSKLMENVINSSASWPWSLTLAAPILPRKPDSVIAIRETLHPFVFYCCNPSQAIDGLPYFFPTPFLICSFIAKKPIRHTPNI